MTTLAVRTESLARAPALTRLQRAMMWLVGASGGVVFIEPAPYEFTVILAMAVFAVATFASAASVPPGAAVTRATDHTVARARRPPHGDHRRTGATRPVTLTQIHPSTTAPSHPGSSTRGARAHAGWCPAIPDVD